MDFVELEHAVAGQLFCSFSSLNGFDAVAIDSRKVIENSLFIPLRGTQQDGHLYIKKALELGACCIIIDQEYKASAHELVAALCEQFSAVCIVVENNLRSLQDAARAYLKKFSNLLKIGITGSSGKTTTKEILASIFSQKYKTVMNEGNLNSETGLPLSVFTIRPEHEVGIFELGMNRRGEIKEITQVLFPDIALITNIGPAHIGILGSQELIAKEKKEIFSQFDETSVGFIPDDEYTSFLKEGVAGSLFVYNEKSIEGVFSRGLDGSEIVYKGTHIHFPLPGKHNVANAIASITIAAYKGISPVQIKRGLEGVKPLFGRSQIVCGDVTYLLDCYNANPDSMASAIDFCNTLELDGRKIYVLASMLELGAGCKAEHQAICKQVVNSDVDAVYLFGDEIVEAGRLTSWGDKKIFYFKNDEITLLSSSLDAFMVKGDFILIKGSRGLALERLEPVLRSGR